MRMIIGILMALHGVAHLPGFVHAWRLGELEGLPYGTTVLAGRVDLGDGGIRVVGAVWLLLALGFVAAGAGALLDRAGWTAAAVVLASTSAAACVLGWPQAKVGLAVNAVLLLALAAGRVVG